ncbi:hypothetical protein N7493_009290 [Penicillium malachiteum]|uniref:Uncharacterized protein n=1 Tax=Penicillium malachiteum TaxID=1324776 RepID=A0AAD6HG78_9EURO|nr:hypothetical protein N7493_009290 [Penicillium malachiteum]
MGSGYRAEDPETHGSSIELPAPVPGDPDTNDEPGHWAAYIYQLRFTSARRNEFIKAPFLRWLRHRPIIREPILRRRFNYTPTTFNHMLDTEVANVEAAYMHMVGEESIIYCNPCLARDGPFAICIKVAGYPGVTCCANCHWWNNDRRREVDSTPAMIPAPPPLAPSGGSGARPSRSRASSSWSESPRLQRHPRQNPDHQSHASEHRSHDYGRHDRE